MNFDLKEIATVGMVLFAVIDIVGTVPIIVDLRNKHGHIDSEKASLVAAIIMIVFLFVGEGFSFLKEDNEVLYFANTQTLKSWFDAQAFSNKTILLKGSRKNALENLLKD